MMTHPTHDALMRALAEAHAEIERLHGALATQEAVYTSPMSPGEVARWNARLDEAEEERDALRKALAALVAARRGEYGDLLPSRLWDAARAALGSQP